MELPVRLIGGYLVFWLRCFVVLLWPARDARSLAWKTPVAVGLLAHVALSAVATTRCLEGDWRPTLLFASWAVVAAIVGGFLAYVAEFRLQEIYVRRMLQRGVR